MSDDEVDTPSLGIPAGIGARRPEEAVKGEREPPTRDAERRPWQLSCTYEFSAPETALVYVACVVAAALVSAAWPVIEMVGPRVGVRLAGEGEQGVRERMTWREATTWARRLGGRELVNRNDGSGPQAR